RKNQHEDRGIKTQHVVDFKIHATAGAGTVDLEQLLWPPEDDACQRKPHQEDGSGNGDSFALLPYQQVSVKLVHLAHERIRLTKLAENVTGVRIHGDADAIARGRATQRDVAGQSLVARESKRRDARSRIGGLKFFREGVQGELLP